MTEQLQVFIYPIRNGYEAIAANLRATGTTAREAYLLLRSMIAAKHPEMFRSL